MSTTQYYRLSPVLWDSVPGRHTATVYGIDRIPEGPLANYVTCCARCKDDPAYTWAGPTFFRLVMPGDIGSCCSGPQDVGNGVVYSRLFTWLNWAFSQGYSLGGNIDNIGPLNDFTLLY